MTQTDGHPEVRAASGHGSPVGRAAVDLYWLPLGAGTPVVRLCGRIYEALVARSHRRTPRALYHAALEVEGSGARVVIELTPVPRGDPAARGVVRTGAVGSRLVRRFRVFRYELRCWSDGTIPDLAFAVGGRHRVSVDPAVARRVLEATRRIPTPVWGRDELRAGEMWNSNSVVSWLLATGGVEMDTVGPPPGGRAPGWDAGLVIASRG